MHDAGDEHGLAAAAEAGDRQRADAGRAPGRSGCPARPRRRPATRTGFRRSVSVAMLRVSPASRGRSAANTASPTSRLARKRARQSAGVVEAQAAHLAQQQPADRNQRRAQNSMPLPAASAGRPAAGPRSCRRSRAASAASRRPAAARSSAPRSGHRPPCPGARRWCRSPGSRRSRRRRAAAPGRRACPSPAA